MLSLPPTGYDTSVAGNPHDAVEAFRSAEVFPDTVLIDADLPEFSATGALIKQLQVGRGGGHNGSGTNGRRALVSASADSLPPPACCRR